jgi:hypothetical protein
MKPAIITGLFLMAGLWAVGSVPSWGASVEGYWRDRGTYVEPYQRTRPDSRLDNNYGYPGNYNPNSGRITPGNTWPSLRHDSGWPAAPKRQSW